MTRWKTLARVRLPLTIDERLAIMHIVERHHGEVMWRQVPLPDSKWFEISARRRR